VAVIGVGGISRATDIIQYVIAGASLVAIGTAAMQDPKLATKLVDDLESWCHNHGVKTLTELRGTLRWER
jgi:dihydroorotate dehydrogenase (NAD+) catalytic subunit